MRSVDATLYKSFLVSSLVSLVRVVDATWWKSFLVSSLVSLVRVVLQHSTKVVIVGFELSRSLAATSTLCFRCLFHIQIHH